MFLVQERGLWMKVEREQLIGALLVNGTIRATADALGVSPATVYSGMNEAGFKEEFDKTKMEILQGVCNKLTSSLFQGVEVVTEVMNNAENSPQIRLNATQQLFNIRLRLGEQVEVLERLSRLEERFENEQNSKE